MGKGKPKQQVTEFFLSQHFGICIGIPDELLDIRVEEKVAWSGSATNEQDISINRDDLFGGIKKEGGVVGKARFYPGKPDQVLTDFHAQKLGRPDGASTPGFRGFASLFFTAASGNGGFYWRANQPIIPPPDVLIKRIRKRADDSEQWYVEKAAFDSCQAASQEAIIRLEMFNVSSGFPNLGYFISGLPGGFNGGPQSIPISQIETTSSLAFNVIYPHPTAPNSFIRDFYWRGAGAPLPVGQEFTLQMQWNSGGFSNSTFRVSIKNAGANAFTAVPTKPGSENSSGSDGIFPISGGLFPRDWQFDTIGAVAPGAQEEMNAIHIIHEALTDQVWGMGTPLAALDDASFRAAADTIYDELLGLSLGWFRQMKIEDFIQEVLDHINAVLYSDPRTGLLTIDLIRGDYDPDALDTLTPDNADLSSFSRKLWGEITNEIQVTYTNRENEQEETITVQDDASIAIQGGTISSSRNYYGIRCAERAIQLAYRDLAADGQPLASVKAIVDRSQYLFRPGSVIKITWPEKGLVDVVFRVTTVDYGKPGQPEIEVDLVEDVFGREIGSFGIPASSLWIDPSQAPEPFDQNIAFTMPYYFTVNSVIGETVESAEYPEVGVGVVVRSDNTDAFEYDLWSEITNPDLSTEDAALQTNSINGSALLDVPLVKEATSSGVIFDNLLGEAPVQSGFVLFDPGNEEESEIALITAAGSSFTLSRGVLDTVPREWPVGTLVFFLSEESVFEDPLIRSGGEMIDYRALMRTSQGRLAYDDASDFSITTTDRFWLPHRPANVLVEGEGFSTETDPVDAVNRANPWIEVTWANRNREDEDLTVLSWTAANATPEAGQTTTIEVRDVDGALLTTHDALAGTSFNVPDASFGTETIVELRVYSSRADGSLVLDSLQYSSHWVLVGGIPRRIHEGDEARRAHDEELRVIHP